MKDKLKKIAVLVIFLAILGLAGWYMYTNFLLHAE
jgi:hypothetical protein